MHGGNEIEQDRDDVAIAKLHDQRVRTFLSQYFKLV